MTEGSARARSNRLTPHNLHFAILIPECSLGTIQNQVLRVSQSGVSSGQLGAAIELAVALTYPIAGHKRDNRPITGQHSHLATLPAHSTYLSHDLFFLA